MQRLYGVLVLAAAVSAAVGMAAAGEREEQLLEATRRGDVQAVRRLIAEGANVNTATRYGMTPLLYACDRGREAVVEALLEAGADVNARDSFFHMTPLAMATVNGHAAIVTRLTKAGARDAPLWLKHAAVNGSTELVQALLAGRRFSRQELTAAKVEAEACGHAGVVRLLEEAAGGPLPPLKRLTPDALAPYAGDYASEEPQDVRLEGVDGLLVLSTPGRGSLRFVPAGPDAFENGVNRLEFQRSGERVVGFRWISPYRTTEFHRLAREAPKRTVAGQLADDGPLPAVHWPSFRGPAARGLSGGDPPLRWDVPEDLGVRWKTPIAGLGHSSPVVWGDRVFVTTAVSRQGDQSVRIGLYGATTSADDLVEHAWKLICLDKTTGRVLWQRVAERGVPPVKRHIKSSHANPTPATDGRRVVAAFDSGGLFCYDVEGNKLWERRLGLLDCGAFNDPDQQWGYAASPFVYKDRVIVQVDRQQDCYIAAFSLADGRLLWKTPRDEHSSWASPTVVQTSCGPVLATNATEAARGYDPETGRELWRLAPNSEIAVPTPFGAYDLIFVASGYRPVQPIYAVRPTARGNVSLDPGRSSNEHVAWSVSRGGPYLPTPLAYRGLLYTCSNNGILTCYDARTGERMYRERFARGEATSFAASPVAAAGRIYLTAEAGVVYVVAAGPRFRLLAENRLGEYCLATPAITERMIIFRTLGHVAAAGGE